jgi:hypothetical protein
MHEHHIVPRVQGGLNLPTVFLCVPCHASVHTRTWNPHHVRLTREGLARAKASGERLGRPNALDPQQQAAVRAALQAGASVAAVAKQFDTSRQTIMRVRDAA